MVTRFAPKRDLHMLPYSAKRTKLIGRLMKLVLRPRQAQLIARSATWTNPRTGAWLTCRSARVPTRSSSA